MRLSPFFHHLRSAYVAELDDMGHDSEGTPVLQQRLAQRRSELGFLVHMLELSPEMVAVVFHQAFQFHAPMAMVQLLGCEPEELPDWDSLCAGITIAPWADAMVQTIRAQSAGDWFMAVAAAAEFMLGLDGDGFGEPHHDAQAHGSEDADPADGIHYLSADDDARGEAQTREEAGADWMAEQGFDRKD